MALHIKYPNKMLVASHGTHTHTHNSFSFSGWLSLSLSLFLVFGLYLFSARSTALRACSSRPNVRQCVVLAAHTFLLESRNTRSMRKLHATHGNSPGKRKRNREPWWDAEKTNDRTKKINGDTKRAEYRDGKRGQCVCVCVCRSVSHIPVIFVFKRPVNGAEHVKTQCIHLLGVRGQNGCHKDCIYAQSPPIHM